jgi:hypothetical protein
MSDKKNSRRKKNTKTKTTTIKIKKLVCLRKDELMHGTTHFFRILPIQTGVVSKEQLEVAYHVIFDRYPGLAYNYIEKAKGDRIMSLSPSKLETITLRRLMNPRVSVETRDVHRSFVEQLESTHQPLSPSTSEMRTLHMALVKLKI